ncbi:DEAD-domain-containing protein [Polychaeton citri CBS 116435]|uniref:ATP-dependent RNA helicase n=1 Tax=Polychaeton citri CBS 116435 TaxID=1314669 RepID=A0A9P4Q6A0_9PEZI|nr:DEAD-domain-containing protein [Polychaeton citri CBS 116435]
MAVPKRKQDLSSKPPKHGASKRRRVAKNESTSNTGDRKERRLDKLLWKKVALPDRLDDYEGFYGLEEVDDVELLRDPSTGGIKFMSPSGRNDDSASEDGDVPDGDFHVDSEWNGLEDDDKSHTATVGARDHLTEPRSAPKAKSSAKDAIKANGAKDKSQTKASAFAQLAEHEGNNVDFDVTAWRSLKLSPDTLASLANLKFTKPTPIQTQCIPEILAGNDVIGKASTGSGKTLAYGIPILERYLERRSSGALGHSHLALILSPTRELAYQITNHIKSLCGSGIFEEPRIATVTGGLSVQKQQRLLQDADIVIGTPGRLWEVISSGHGLLAALRNVQYFVVDEADRLLSEGNFKEAEEIINVLNSKHDLEDTDGEEDDDKPSQDGQIERQTLVFSATFDRSLQRKLSAKSHSGNNILKNEDATRYLLSKLPFRGEPSFVDVNPVAQMASGLKEGLVECPAGTDKDLYLYAAILLNVNLRTLVFTNSVSAVRRLVPFLQNLSLPALALHSGMPQKARLRSVERFSDVDKGSIMVATDVAARGLDIPNIQLVLHYHLPRQADMYVHRSGRTARAGNIGSSILLCAPEEVAGVRRLVAKVHAESAVANDDKAGIGEAKRQGFYIRTLDIDRKVVARLKLRATLSKQIADAQIAQEKGNKEDSFLKKAAEELGVDYDSEEFEAQGQKGKRGRGAGRARKEKEARGMSKAELGGMRAELKSLLRERVNVGVSEKYIASGRVDVNELLRQKESGGKTGEFLGNVGSLGLDD